MTTTSRPYHHGDLATALLDAAQDELAEKGIEAFSLRGVAKRAGVSHAAPAHHFKDVQGLLTALATRGFERFVQRQSEFRRRAEKDARSQLVASGLGYVVFATENPALFRLMFGSNRTNFEDEHLGHAASRAYDELVIHVARAKGLDVHAVEDGHAMLDADFMQDVAASWAVAHGLADLLVAGRMESIGTLPAKARHSAIAAVLRRVIT
ncbi:MAG: TetR/AcrR family transcriptional regulator [Burkholderiales bacterium]|nr:TetR/AcrR family transcriptional regulator [Burkholderiales bacterium]